MCFCIPSKRQPEDGYTYHASTANGMLAEIEQQTRLKDELIVKKVRYALRKLFGDELNCQISPIGTAAEVKGLEKFLCTHYSIECGNHSPIKQFEDAPFYPATLYDYLTKKPQILKEIINLVVLEVETLSLEKEKPTSIFNIYLINLQRGASKHLLIYERSTGKYLTEAGFGCFDNLKFTPKLNSSTFITELSLVIKTTHHTHARLIKSDVLPLLPASRTQPNAPSNIFSFIVCCFKPKVNTNNTASLLNGMGPTSDSSANQSLCHLAVPSDVATDECISTILKRLMGSKGYCKISNKITPMEGSYVYRYMDRKFRVDGSCRVGTSATPSSIFNMMQLNAQDFRKVKDFIIIVIEDFSMSKYDDTIVSELFLFHVDSQCKADHLNILIYCSERKNYFKFKNSHKESGHNYFVPTITKNTTYSKLDTKTYISSVAISTLYVPEDESYDHPEPSAPPRSPSMVLKN